MLTDDDSSLKVCKHCGKAFAATRPNMEFCSPQCNARISTMYIRAGRRKIIYQHRRSDCIRNSSIIMYTTEDGLTKIETTFDEDTVWLSLDQMAELFQRDKSTISRHIKNIFEEGELQRNSVVANFATTASDGKTYQVDYYNLDVIISVGYRVKSHRGTQFRIWAMGILKEYINILEKGSGNLCYQH